MDFGHTFEGLGDDREDFEDVERQLNNAKHYGVQDVDAADDDKDSLLYSAGTGTLGNSSLNFGFSVTKNNLSLKAAQLNQQQQHLKAPLQNPIDLNLSDLSDINLAPDQNDQTVENESPENTEIVNNMFNL